MWSCAQQDLRNARQLFSACKDSHALILSRSTTLSRIYRDSHESIYCTLCLRSIRWAHQGVACSAKEIRNGAAVKKVRVTCESQDKISPGFPTPGQRSKSQDIKVQMTSTQQRSSNQSVSLGILTVITSDYNTLWIVFRVLEIIIIPLSRCSCFCTSFVVC